MALERRLRIALAIFRLVPTGGREQQCLALAGELAQRGHAVTIVCTRGAAPPLPGGVTRLELPRRGRTNHGRLAAFAADAARATEGGFDATVAFHIVPGFDAIFCADPIRPPAGVLGWLPRQRTFAALEAKAFAPGGPRVIALAEPQWAAMRSRYALPPERGEVLPPAVDPARRDPAAVERAPSEDAPPVWLWSGLAPRTKGLDRVVAALARAPSARLRIAGLTADDAKARRAQQLARRLGVADRVEWLGFLSGEQLLAAMAGADLLVHPARSDVTGNVILEAMINGLPVIATDVCGFAGHIRRAEAGVVLEAPFDPAALDAALARAGAATRAAWSRNALAYGRAADLFGGVARAADLVEAWPRTPAA